MESMGSMIGGNSQMDPAMRTNEGFRFQATKVQRINDSLDRN